jgi:hypothetical protein
MSMWRWPVTVTTRFRSLTCPCDADLSPWRPVFGPWHVHVTLTCHRDDPFSVRDMSMWRWPVTATTRFRSLTCPCKICVARNDTRTGFSPGTSVFHCQYPPVGLLHAHLHRNTVIRRTNGRSLGKLNQSNALSEKGGGTLDFHAILA